VAISRVFIYKPPINQSPLRGRDVLLEDILAKRQTALAVAESRDDPVRYPEGWFCQLVQDGEMSHFKVGGAIRLDPQLLNADVPRF